MKAIVFGGTGFIGSHVVEQLKLSGHEVTVAVRETSNTTFLKKLGVNIVKIDFQDHSLIGHVIKGHNVVFNCIADPNLGINKDIKDSEEIILAKKLIKEAAKNRANRFIQLSTIVVYDFRTEEPIDESYETKPDYPIQRFKLEKDQVIQEIGLKEGISTIILRPASTIGLRDVKSFFSRLLYAHSNDQYPLPNNGESKVSLIDTRDIGHCMVFLGDTQEKNIDGVYLLKGFDTTWQELKNEIDHAVGRTAKIVPIPDHDHSFASKTLTVNRIWNDHKIRRLGFETKYTLSDAVRMSVDELL